MRARHLKSIAPLTIFGLLAACGSGDAGVAGPKPPVEPNNPVATSLAVMAGADQSADPGTNVAVAPVVIVKDAAGAAMSGVPVQFSIVSGGGSVTLSNAVTSSSGTASPGAWKLGPTEGRNELRAAAGSLPPLSISATAAITSRTVSDTTVVAGTITVTTDGPLKGTQLVVPTGAFGAAQRWTLAQQPTTAWPKRANLNFAPVGLRVTGTASGTSASAMTLTIPTTPVDGQKTFVIMRDPATGGMIVLNAIGQSSTSITVSASHFDGSFLSPPNAAPAFLLARSTPRAGAQAATGYDAVVVATIPVAELDKDYDTGYRPGVDDWDFRPVKNAMTDEPTDLGKTIGSMVYYGYLRGRGSLYKRYRLAPDVDYSNRAGIRSSAYLQSLLPADNMLAALTAIRTSTRAGAADQIFYDVLKANMFVTGLPQLLVAEFQDPRYDGLDELHYNMKFLTVYRTSGSQVMIADPVRPGDATVSLQFSNGRFAPLSVPIGLSGTVATAEFVDVIAPSTWLKMKELSTDLSTILDGDWPNVGNSLRFPEYRFKVRGDATLRDSVLFLRDTARTWVECATCHDWLTNPLLTPARMQPFVLYRGADALGTAYSSGLLWDKVESRADALGVLVVSTSNTNGVGAKWLDWMPLQAKQWSIRFTPAAPNTGVDRTTNFTATVIGPTTPRRKFTWNFGDDSPIESTGSTSAVNHKYTTAGKFLLTVTMTEDTSSLVLAKDTVSVMVTQRSWAAWRIASLNLAVTDPYRNALIAPGESDATYWSNFKGQARVNSAEALLVRQVEQDSIELFGMANGSLNGAIVYLDKDTVSRNPPGALTRQYNSTKGMYFVVGNNIPTGDLVMAYALDADNHQLASSTASAGKTYHSCEAAWDWGMTTTGAPLSGIATVNGSAWSALQVYILELGEARRRPAIQAQVDANGRLSGTITMKYRLSHYCGLTPSEAKVWTITATFDAFRIR